MTPCWCSKKSTWRSIANLQRKSARAPERRCVRRTGDVGVVDSDVKVGRSALRSERSKKRGATKGEERRTSIRGEGMDRTTWMSRGRMAGVMSEKMSPRLPVFRVSSRRDKLRRAGIASQPRRACRPCCRYWRGLDRSCRRRRSVAGRLRRKERCRIRMPEADVRKADCNQR